MLKWPNYEASNKFDEVLGGTYNWYVVETGKLCPSGWHVPSSAEWTILTDYLIEQNYFAGEEKNSQGDPNVAKALSSSNWDELETEGPYTPADRTYSELMNVVGFTAVPNKRGKYYDGVAFDKVYWWTSANVSATLGRTRLIDSYRAGVHIIDAHKSFRHSIRCIKD